MGFFTFLQVKDNVFKNTTISMVLDVPADPNYPPQKAITLPISDPARIAIQSQGGFYFSQNGPAEWINQIAIIGHNLSKYATIHLYGGDLPRPDGTQFAVGIPWREGVIHYRLDPPRLYRFWSIQFFDDNNYDNFLQIGYIMAGLTTTFEFGFTMQWEYAEDFLNTRGLSQWGRRFAYKGYRMARARVNFENLKYLRSTGPKLDPVDQAAQLRALVRDLRGDATPFFWKPDRDSEEAFFGYATLNISENRAARASTTFEFVEDNPGKYIPNVQPLIWKAGDDITKLGGTFTRDGWALYTRYDNYEVGAAPNTPRTEHYATEGAKTLLLERSTDNNLTWSEDLTQAVWTKAYVNLTYPTLFAPTGAGNATKVTEISGGPYHVVWRECPWITVGHNIVFSFYAAAAERNWIGIYTVDKANTPRRSWVNLLTGTVGTKDAGHTIRLQPSLYGWYRVICLFNAGSGSHPTPGVQVELCNGDGGTFYSGDGVSGAYFWGFQCETGDGSGVLLDASSYIGTTTAVVTRANDNLSFPIPNEFLWNATIYLKFIERRWASQFYQRVMQISDEAGTLPHMWIDQEPGGYYRVVYYSQFGILGGGGGVPIASQPNDLVEIRVTMQQGGQTTIYVMINSVQERAMTGYYTAGAGASPWNNKRIWLSCVPPHPSPQVFSSSAAWMAVKIVRGLHSMEEMRRLEVHL